MKLFLLIVIIFFQIPAFAQFLPCECNLDLPADDCQNMLADPTVGLSYSSYMKPVEFKFDDMSDYYAGLNISGQVQLRINVKDPAVPTGNCVWGLKMYITTDDVAPNWKSWATYGHGTGNPPLFNLLEVKVTNGCQTPDNLIDNTWVPFPAAPNYGPNYVINIIDNLAQQLPCANCGVACRDQEVNTVGSFLTYYDQYTFNIDFKIKPGFSYIAGNYKVKVWFCIYEH
ncbi:MAG: hypothetical protein HY840_13950 [Bacteroidetes bacterium]|nr:hypothetical protein [Bacteroidota bacterium]